jgi:chaperonin GroEL
VALLRARRPGRLKGDNDDQQAGIDIVRRALQAPIRQIAENAGVEGSVVVGKILDQKDATFGYNAQTGEYGDMFARASSTRPRSCAPRCRTRPRSPAC